MAKQALLQRELKREKLAAKFATKYAELQSVAKSAKHSDEERRAKIREMAFAGEIPGITKASW